MIFLLLFSLKKRKKKRCTANISWGAVTVYPACSAASLLKPRFGKAFVAPPPTPSLKGLEPTHRHCRFFSTTRRRWKTKSLVLGLIKFDMILRIFMEACWWRCDPVRIFYNGDAFMHADCTRKMLHNAGELITLRASACSLNTLSYLPVKLRWQEVQLADAGNAHQLLVMSQVFLVSLSLKNTVIFFFLVVPVSPTIRPCQILKGPVCDI